MEFMTLAQLRSNAAKVRSAFDTLMSNKTVVVRQNARQWRFFRLCLDRTLGGAGVLPRFGGPQDLAQLKFEVQDKLRRFYLRHNVTTALAFSLMHARELLRMRLTVCPDYPHTSGYYLLVRNTTPNEDHGSRAPAEPRAYLETVVTSCIDAEFNAYRTLPHVDEVALLRWFSADGGAYRELAHSLARLRALGWVLSNPLNPSTKRLLAIEVKELRRNEAVIRTTEYWYLRWWSTLEHAYLYPYRETSRHTYVLSHGPDGWRVQQNIRPEPRSIAPYR